MKNNSNWELVYDDFSPLQDRIIESLCSLGNGYMGNRGTSPESIASDIYYPATYIAGLYNRLDSQVGERTISNEDFVNCPNWTSLTFSIDGEDWFSPLTWKLHSYQKKLNLRDGVLIRTLRAEDQKGRITRVEIRRLVHMKQFHSAAIEYRISPENYSGSIIVRTMLDGSVINAGVERYKSLSSKHWKLLKLGKFAKNGIFLEMRTSQSRIKLVEASRIDIYQGRSKIKPRICVSDEAEIIQSELVFPIVQGKTYTVEKFVSIHTSRDPDAEDQLTVATREVQALPRFSKFLASHQRVWHQLWEKFDLEIEGDDFAQLALRLDIFHLLQTASHCERRLDVGFPARGLYGEAYRGHIFWDDVYVQSFYDLHDSDISASFLKYRYHRLGAARSLARESGYRGSMFPWQSASSGREETQELHWNPVSGEWGEDHSYLQRHVSFAIAYDAWQHFQLSGDAQFFQQFGAELILSVAQFAASLCLYSEEDGRYHTEGLMGPDEFHEKLPGADRPGFRDNAYSNIMIVWVLRRAAETLDLLPVADRQRLKRRLKLTARDSQLWDDISKKINLVISPEGIISQFDGYLDLPEFPWEQYRERYSDISRLDRILKAEGKSPDQYQVGKQADLLMAFYLLPSSELKQIFQGLGYSFTQSTLCKNYDYYVQRTSHGSTLSEVVYGFLAHSLGKLRDSRKYFLDSLRSDLHCAQGCTTPEGIHTGVMGGSIDMAVRAFAGIEFLPDRIRISPRLPARWKSLKFKLRYRGSWITFVFNKKSLKIFIAGRRGTRFRYPFEFRARQRVLTRGQWHRLD